MMKIVYVNEQEARVTKAFAKNACVFGTEEFKCWREYKALYPDAQMKTKQITRNPEKKTRRNMTYENMTLFISTLDNREAYMAQFNIVRQRSHIQKSPYQYVLNWFEATFGKEIDLADFAKKEEKQSSKVNESKSA